MRKGYGQLAQRADTLAQAPVAELVELFGPWLPVAQAVGPPKRDRLFSPLTHLLALLGPGAWSRRLLRRGGAQGPGVARTGGEATRFTQDRRLL